LQYVDYDHDGLTGIVLVNDSMPIKVFRHTGQGFSEDTGMETYWGALPPFVGTVGNNSHSQTASLADINGDGVLDLVSFTSGSIYLGGVCPPKTFGCIITSSGRVLPEGMLLQSFGLLGEDANFAWDRAPFHFAIATVCAHCSQSDRESLGQQNPDGVGQIQLHWRYLYRPEIPRVFSGE
jgi:hypothetical protein